MTPRATARSLAPAAALITLALLYAALTNRRSPKGVSPQPSLSPVAVASAPSSPTSPATRSAAPPSVDAGSPPQTVAGTDSSDSSHRGDGEPEDGAIAARWCAKLRIDNAALFAKLTARVDAALCTFTPPDVDCTAAPGVAWGYRLQSLVTAARPNEEDCVLTERVQLVRLAADGVSAVGPSQTLEYASRTKRNSIGLRLLTDYDSDGERELLLVRDSAYAESVGERTAEVLTYKDGRLSKYGPAANIKIVTVADVDDDGRLDLISEGPYSSVTMHGAFGEYPLAPPLFAWHSSADGTFSIDDPASVAFTRRACPSRPHVSFTRDELSNGGSPPVRDAICESLWGGSNAVGAAWDNVCAQFDASTDEFACQTWPKQVASIKPPFLLR